MSKTLDHDHLARSGTNDGKLLSKRLRDLAIGFERLQFDGTGMDREDIDKVVDELNEMQRGAEMLETRPLTPWRSRP